MCPRWVSIVRVESEELLCDLGVGVAQGDQAQDVGFACGQVFGRAGGFG